MTFRAGALVFGFFILGISAQAQAICIVFGPGLCAVSCRGTNDEITAELIHDASANEKACALTFAKDTTTLGLLLERGVDINTQTTISYKNWPAGSNALSHVIFTRRMDLFSFLLKKKIDVNTQDEHGTTALMHAVWDGNEKMVEELLKAGALPNLKDRFGESALCHAKRIFIIFRSAEVIATLEHNGGVCEN